MPLTARGKPRIANTTRDATSTALSPPVTTSAPSECFEMDMELMIAVPAMQANTIKLLKAHTSRGPICLHIGSIKKELMPRTTYKKKQKEVKRKRMRANIASYMFFPLQQVD